MESTYPILFNITRLDGRSRETLAVFFSVGVCNENIKACVVYFARLLLYLS